MLRRHKTEEPIEPDYPTSRRLIIVDDLPEAGHLLGQLLRRVGYEVAEIGDHPTAINTLLDQPEPVAGVVASFTTAGTSAGLRLVDAFRNHHRQELNTVRVLLISDQPRQQIFCLQAGADAILLRPFSGDELVEATIAMITRPESERVPYRRAMVAQVKQQQTEESDGNLGPRSVAGQFV